MNDEWRQRLVAHADQAYATRHVLQNVHQSVAFLRTAYGLSENFEIAWRLSRALFFLGQEAQAASLDTSGNNRKLRQFARQSHAKGASAGRHATRFRPERVEGHFWAGVNLALLAACETKPRAAIHALQAKRALQTAIAIDASYHAAGPLRVLARLQHKLPRWLGGGRRRAYANFERALAIAPANTVTRIYFAELLCELGEVNKARAELEKVLLVPDDPAWAFEIARDRQRAREIVGNEG